MAMRTKVAIVATAAVLSVSLSNPGIAGVKCDTSDMAAAHTTLPASEFVRIARSQDGVPYCESADQALKGGQDPCQGGTATSGGLDSSGLVQQSALHVGIAIPRTTLTQWADTIQLRQTSSPTAGSVVYFSVPADGSPEPAHAAVCLNKGCETVVEETGPTGAPARIGPIDAKPCNESGANLEFCIMGYRNIVGISAKVQN